MHEPECTQLKECLRLLFDYTFSNQSRDHSAYNSAYERNALVLLYFMQHSDAGCLMSLILPPKAVRMASQLVEASSSRFILHLDILLIFDILETPFDEATIDLLTVTRYTQAINYFIFCREKAWIFLRTCWPRCSTGLMSGGKQQEQHHRENGEGGIRPLLLSSILPYIHRSCVYMC